MQNVKAFLKDKFLLNAIESHKLIINGGESVRLEEMGFEEGTSLERVHEYNAFTILTKLKFPIEEATEIESESVKLLDDLAKQNLSNEEIIKSLLEYRKEVGN
ncbi:hypothetical protein [Priestia megaterium]|uniref:hypothetical protein n=1 Tax=Priestia megaterium TaxID=1404 RepID=UPI003873185B|nr:hypothetical protein QY062_24530 [Priestia megaterium]